MTHRRTAISETIKAVAAEAGADVEIKSPVNGGHPFAVLRLGGITRKMYFSGTPGDCNAFKQSRRQVRKLLLEMGAAF